MQFFDNKGSNYNSENEDIVFDSDGQDVSSNQKNVEEYQKLMENAAPKGRDYYDKNNMVVKIIMFILLIIIIVGTTFIIMRGTG